MPWRDKRTQITNYRISEKDEEEKTEDQLDKLATVLVDDPLYAQRPRKDRIVVKHQPQEISVEARDKSWYKIEFKELKLKRKFVCFSKAIFNWTPLYPKDDGIISIKLKNKGYIRPDKQIELYHSGRVGSQWSFGGAVNHCIHREDIDNMYLEVCITNKEVNNSVIGELVIYWVFEETDVPFVTEECQMIPFYFKPLKNNDSLALMITELGNTMRKVMKQKSEFRDLKRFLRDHTVADVDGMNAIDTQSSEPIRINNEVHGYGDSGKVFPVQTLDQILSSKNKD